MKSILVSALLSVPSVVHAHPGHAPGESEGLLHYVTDPFHLLVGGGVLGLVLAARHALRNRPVRRID